METVRLEPLVGKKIQSPRFFSDRFHFLVWILTGAVNAAAGYALDRGVPALISVCHASEFVPYPHNNLTVPCTLGRRDLAFVHEVHFRSPRYQILDRLRQNVTRVASEHENPAPNTAVLSRRRRAARRRNGQIRNLFGNFRETLKHERGAVTSGGGPPVGLDQPAVAVLPDVDGQDEIRDAVAAVSASAADGEQGRIVVESQGVTEPIYRD
mmetsp:Transcript_16533/g.32864  ORF Transcript_16533/g.32864 Transcript_16533/m.32864 type:complete len:211 (-) Transcript_16533:284-916(-)